MDKPFLLVTITHIAAMIASAPLCDGAETDHFFKDQVVRIKNPTALYFRSDQMRQAAVGEKFKVIRAEPLHRRLFVLAKDGSGQKIAYNLDANDVELAPLDLEVVRRRALDFTMKDELVAALGEIEIALMQAPGNPTLTNYRHAAVAAKIAFDQLLTQEKKVTATKERIAKLSKAAWMAASSRLDPNGGFARSQEMRVEAERLASSLNAESTAAADKWQRAKTELQTLLSVPIGSDNRTPPEVANTRPAPATDLSISSAPLNTEEPVPLANNKSVGQAPAEFANSFASLPDAMNEQTLEKGRFYALTGKFAPHFQIIQVTGEVIIVADVRPSSYELQAGLIPENPEVLENSRIPTKDGGPHEDYTARSIGKFVGFREITLVTGATKRLPFFTIAALEFYSGRFLNLSGEK